MFTNRAKILGATVIAVIAVGGLGYAQYQTDKQVAKLTEQPPVVQTVIVTPTIEPTATPSATFKTRISTPASVTKGAIK